MTAYSYDANGNVASEIVSLGGVKASWVEYAYNAANELTWQMDVVSNTQSKVTTDSYNAAGELTQENVVDTSTGGTLGQTTTTYDLAGNVLTTTDYYGNKTTNSYDAAGRLSEAVVTGPTGTVVSVQEFTYDDAGNQLSETDATSMSGNNVATGNVTARTYDGAGHRGAIGYLPRAGGMLSGNAMDRAVLAGGAKMTMVKWCCAGFQSHYEGHKPGERGIVVLFGRDTLKRYAVGRN